MRQSRVAESVILIAIAFALHFLVGNRVSVIPVLQFVVLFPTTFAVAAKIHRMRRDQLKIHTAITPPLNNNL